MEVRTCQSVGFGYHFLLEPAHLDKSNVLSILSEALTADIEVVFADNTPLVATHPAA